MNININGMNFGNNNYNNRGYKRQAGIRGAGTTYVINKPWQSLLFCLLFCVIGIMFLVFGISTLSNKDNDNFIETTATVIDREYSYDIDHNRMASIVVEYYVEGARYESVSDYRTSNPKPIGSSVKIKYNPDNPEEVSWNNSLFNFVLPVIGILFIVVGCIGSVKFIKKGLAEGFNSGTNTTVTYDNFGNRIDNEMNGYSRFDYSNQGNQNANNPYAMNNTNDFVNDQNINNPYEANNDYSDFNQNNIDQNNNNF